MSEDLAPEHTESDSSPARKRPRPGERRQQILQTLAGMLEQPGAERVTTAALAARIGVSEAALYRHFASKAQMFEGLIEFVEQSCMGLIRQVTDRDPPGPQQAARMVSLLLQFAEKNPGMCRVMTGDALILEHERLQQRVNLLMDKVEAQLRQALRGASDHTATPTLDVQVSASVMQAFLMGRLQRHVRTGFARKPTEHLQDSLARLL
ncbi:MAG: nucleoid occlusion factor SlmA [Betaproteobacteria bacterium]|nr:nucleoid occlusion factor SlmA [Betaproteobacteria bacterium]